MYSGIPQGDCAVRFAGEKGEYVVKGDAAATGTDKLSCLKVAKEGRPVGWVARCSRRDTGEDMVGMTRSDSLNCIDGGGALAPARRPGAVRRARMAFWRMPFASAAALAVGGIGGIGRAGWFIWAVWTEAMEAQGRGWWQRDGV